MLHFDRSQESIQLARTRWRPRSPPLPRFFSEQEKQNPDLAFMERALDKACEAAQQSAPYHHARLSAMVVGASVTTRIEVTGGMSGSEFATDRESLPAEILPGMVIEAEPSWDADPDDAIPSPGPAAA